MWNSMLRNIFACHGFKEQTKKLNEECQELIESIWEYESEIKPTDKHRDNIAGEIADCLVIINQLKLVYSIDDDLIKSIMKFKIRRQCDRDNIDLLHLLEKYDKTK